MPDADTINAQAIAERQAGEIQRIIDEHNALAMNKEPAEVAEVRRKCSRAITEACQRHVRENNAPAPAPTAVDPNDGKDAVALSLEDTQDAIREKRELEPGGLLDDSGDLGGEDDDSDRKRTAG